MRNDRNHYLAINKQHTHCIRHWHIIQLAILNYKVFLCIVSIWFSMPKVTIPSISLCVFVYIRDQHLNGLHHHQCFCLAEVASNYVGLLCRDASFRPRVRGWAGGVKRQVNVPSREIELQQSGRKSKCLCDWGKMIPPVWCSLIWIWWGWGLDMFSYNLLGCDYLAMGDPVFVLG